MIINYTYTDINGIEVIAPIPSFWIKTDYILPIYPFIKNFIRDNTDEVMEAMEVYQESILDILEDGLTIEYISIETLYRNILNEINNIKRNPFGASRPLPSTVQESPIILTGELL